MSRDCEEWGERGRDCEELGENGVPVVGETGQEGCSRGKKGEQRTKGQPNLLFPPALAVGRGQM